MAVSTFHDLRPLKSVKGKPTLARDKSRAHLATESAFSLPRERERERERERDTHTHTGGRESWKEGEGSRGRP